MVAVPITSKSDRNKLIAAILLGVLALLSLWFAFGGSITGSATQTPAGSPTPGRAGSPKRTNTESAIANRAEQDFTYQSSPVIYEPRLLNAPDPGRNIFAFYEPPPPTPFSPTPFIEKPLPTPTPTPTPPFTLAFISPQTVYAGSKSFRLEVVGDKFTPDARIYLNGVELPTTFTSAQRISTNVPQNFIAAEGNAQVLVKTPDGSKYSLPSMLIIQPPPKPQVKYIGLIARRMGNNDTAYLEEPGKPLPTPARLNDVIGGRFKLISISPEKVVFEDINLGFRHSVELSRPAPGTTSAGAPAPARPGFPQDRNGFQQPGFPQPGTPYYAPGIPQTPTTQGIPGIPDGLPRYIPPGANVNSNVNRPVKRPVDDDDDNDNSDIDNRK